MELSTSKIWTYLKSGRQNPICSTKNSVPLLMEMATCFASPCASPVRGLLALFLLGGRKVWEAWEGRALGRPLLSPVFLLGGRKVWEPGRGRLWVQSYPYIQTSPFSRVFARWPEEGVGSLGGAGFGYRVIPFQTSPFSRVFARWPEGAGSVGAGLGYRVIPFPDLSFLACFCSVAESVGSLGGAGFGYRVICFQASLTCLSLRKTREKEESGKG